MQDYTKLKVWQKSHKATLEIYASTLAFPKEEQYGLTSQLRRASVSGAANIAESTGRKGQADFGRCLQISLGSLHESEYLWLLSRDLNYIKQDKFETVNTRLVEVKAMLLGLIKSLRTENNSISSEL